MGAFVFDRCCFCINLKTGCFIIGYLSLASYSILAILCGLGLAAGAAVMAGAGASHEQGSGIQTENGDNAAALGAIALIVLSLVLLFVVLQLTFVIVLLVGLHKNKPGHVKAYLIYACIFLVLSLLAVVASFFISTPREGSNAGSVVQSIINVLWNVYIILVIRSQYFAMRAPERGPAIYTAP